MMRNFIKSFLLLLIIIVFSTPVFATSNVNTPVVDVSEKVYDFADLFTSIEEENLYADIVNFINENEMDMAVVTINYNNKVSARDYAGDFYDYNKFGIGSTYDGLLFLIDMDNREIWISTTGEAQRVYDDYRIDRILDKAYSEISNQDYYGCASEFVRVADDYAKAGVPNSNINTYIDENGDYVVGTEDSLDFGLSFMIASIITSIFMIVALSKHRMVKKQTHAREYLKNTEITLREDTFLNTHTSKVYISSSSSSGGGSSTHRSSSGRSHGGGGRRF